MKITGEVLTWTGIGIGLAVAVGVVAEVWFDANISTVLDTILSAIK